MTGSCRDRERARARAGNATTSACRSTWTVVPAGGCGYAGGGDAIEPVWYPQSRAFITDDLPRVVSFYRPVLCCCAQLSLCLSFTHTHILSPSFLSNTPPHLTSMSSMLKRLANRPGNSSKTTPFEPEPEKGPTRECLSAHLVPASQHTTLDTHPAVDKCTTVTAARRPASSRQHSSEHPETCRVAGRLDV